MISLLDREMYAESEAAHILRVPTSTLHWWLEGEDRDGHRYESVIRPDPTGSKIVTWGEFVEARYLREYRRKHKVSLQKLRRFIAVLRERTDVTYPLAHHRPWVGEGKRLLLAAQQEAGLEPDLWPVIEPATGQILLLPQGQAFLEVVEFGPDDDGPDRPSSVPSDKVVRRLRPAGSDSPVVIDPDVRFGAPSVGGISTAVLVELLDAGEALETIAEEYDLSLDEALAAVLYERRIPSAA